MTPTKWTPAITATNNHASSEHYSSGCHKSCRKRHSHSASGRSAGTGRWWVSSQQHHDDDKHEGRVSPPVAAGPVIISYESRTAVLELSTDPTIRSLQPANIAPPCCKVISQAHEALRQSGSQALTPLNGEEKRERTRHSDATARAADCKACTRAAGDEEWRCSALEHPSFHWCSLPCTHAAGRVAGEGRGGVVGHALTVEDGPTALSQEEGRHGHQPVSTSQCCMAGDNGIAGAGVVMGPDYKGCGQASPTCCQGGRSRRTRSRWPVTNTCTTLWK